jgi:hypothetical protein
MLASVLNSPIAVQASVEVVRAFIRLREILATRRQLARKLAELEQKYDEQFKAVFDAIRGVLWRLTQWLFSAATAELTGSCVSPTWLDGFGCAIL